MTNEQKLQIKQLRESGFGYTAIAESLSLTKFQVSSYCYRNDLGGRKSDTHATERPDNDYCRCCGKVLTQVPKQKRFKFCSKECRVKWWNSHPEKVYRRAFYNFTCAHCGKEFTAYGNANRKFCSHSCYIAERFKGGNDCE